MQVLKVNWILPMIWKLYLLRCLSTNNQICGLNMHISHLRTSLSGGMIYSWELLNWKSIKRRWFLQSHSGSLVCLIQCLSWQLLSNQLLEQKVYHWMVWTWRLQSQMKETQQISLKQQKMEHLFMDSLFREQLGKMVEEESKDAWVKWFQKNLHQSYQLCMLQPSKDISKLKLASTLVQYTLQH